MTAEDLAAARKTLGMNAAALGRALELEGEDPGRSVRLWEKGRPVPGPVAVAVRYMLADQARQRLQDAVQEAQAILTPDAPPAPAQEPHRVSIDDAFAGRILPKTRRRS